MSIEKWNVIESKRIADCRVFKVREDLSENASTGKRASFYIVENPDWINVIPVTKHGQVVLIEQYRHGAQCVTLEIPRGMVDRGETPDACARRELLEETGYRADRVVYLGRSLPNPAIQTNWIYHFAALGCENTGVTNFDEHESIQTRLVKLDDIAKLIENEEITHSLVIAGFQRFESWSNSASDHIYES